MSWRSRDEVNKERRLTTVPAGGGNGNVSYSWGDSLILEPVLDDPRRQLISAAPPGSPATGDRYLVPPDATGDWTGHANKIAEWNGSVWTLAYPFNEIFSLYGVNLGTDGDKGVLVYSRARGEYLEYVKIEQEDLGTTVWKQRSDVGATPANYMAWLPLHTADQPHSIVKDRIDSVDVLPASWGTPYPYQKRVIPAASPSPWNVHIGEIAMYVGISSVGGGAWIMQVPAEGDVVWVADKNQYYHYSAAGAWVPLGNNITLNDLSDVNTAGAANTNVLSYNSGSGTWVPAAAGGTLALDDLTDVVIAAPASGNVLSYNGTNWVNSAAAAHALNAHTDTNLGSPGAGENGYVVSWNNGTSRYVLTAPSAPGAHTLDSHSNVTISSIAANHKLRWNGSAWVNVLDNLDSLTDVVITAAVTGDILYYDGTNWVDYPFATLLAAHNHTLDSLSNVSTGSKVSGDALIWNGVAWVPGSVTATVTAYFIMVWLTGLSGSVISSNGVTYAYSGGIHTLTPTVAGKYLISVNSDVNCRIDVAGTPYSATLPTGAQTILHRSAGGAVQIRFPSTAESANANITMTKIGD